MTIDYNQERAICRRLLSHHEHQGTGTTLERSNCAACVLKGYGDAKLSREEGCPVQPNHSGWARIYVCAGEKIPSKYRTAFIGELDSSNRAYAEALRRDIIQFGLIID